MSDADTIRRCLDGLMSAEPTPIEDWEKVLDVLDRLVAENQRLRDGLNSILSFIENANVPYERLQVGALARAALDGTP